MQDHKNGRGSFGYQCYTITAAAKANPLDVRPHIAGKHYFRIYDGTPPTRGRVHCGQKSFEWNEGPHGMYSNGRDFVDRHSRMPRSPHCARSPQPQWRGREEEPTS